MSTLIVDLSHAWRHTRAELAFVLSQDGVSVQHGQTQAALLPAAHELVAVVPPNALSWHVLRLPEGLKLHARSEPNKLRAVLMGMMEEQLLSASSPPTPDPSSPQSAAAAPLHLAVFDHPQAQHLWVAVCDASDLRAALQVLEDAGRVVQRVVPAYAPAAEPSLHVLGDGSGPWVFCHDQGVLSLPGGDATWRVLLNLPGVSAEALHLHAEPAAVASTEHKTGRPVALQTPTQHLLGLAASPFNLAQHTLAPSRRSRGQKWLAQACQNLWQSRAWRPARVAFALLVLVNLLGIKLLAWQEQALLQAKRTQAAQVLQTTFPEVTLVVDAPLQMARSAAQLQRGNDVDAGLVLHTVAQTLPQAQVTGLVMSPSELRLQGLTLDTAQRQQLQSAFKAAGLNAQATGNDWVLGRQP